MRIATRLAPGDRHGHADVSGAATDRGGPAGGTASGALSSCSSFRGPLLSQGLRSSDSLAVRDVLGGEITTPGHVAARDLLDGLDALCRTRR